MPSFLLTDRMDPALKQRVLLALKSDLRERAGGQPVRKGHALVRLLVVLGVGVTVTFLTTTYRASRAEVRREKAELRQRYETQAAAFDAGFRARSERVQQLLAHAADPYPGDWIDPQLREAARFDALWSRPVVYVRGPLRGFLTDADRRQTNREVVADALIRCLIVPPPSIKESELLRHLGRIYQPARFVGKFYDFEPVHAAFSFLDAGFFARALADAERMKEVVSLGRELERAHLSRAAQARHVELFVLALDEPKNRGAVADFDGEAEHFIRLIAVDLSTPRVWWRVRRQVDPQWLSEKSRLAYSRELDSCRLAWELRQEITLPGDLVEKP